MDASIKDGNLVIPIRDIIQHLTPTELSELAQAVACSDDVVKSVVDQLVDGFTENVSHGSSHELHGHRVRILEAVDKVRFRVVRELMNELAAKKFSEQRADYWALDLWRSWPESMLHLRPEVPRDWNPNYPTDAEVRAVAEGGAP